MTATLAKHADRLNLHHRAVGLPPMILVTDRHRMPDPVAAAARLRPGDAVLLRDYDAPDRTARAATLAAVCKAHRLLLIVGGDIGLAHEVGARGVHWPAAALRRRAPGRTRRSGFIVTTAAHGWQDLVAARRAGADAALLSPVFPTRSHPGAPDLGVTRFAALVSASPLPVYALGGVNPATAPRLTGSGAIGLAAIEGLLPPWTPDKKKGRTEVRPFPTLKSR